MTGWKHGASRYQKHGCRCDICVEGNKEHKRIAREKNPPRYPPHRNIRQWPLQALADVVPDAKERIGADWSQWNRSMEYGMSDRTADHWAIKCGVHPSYVWGEAWDLAGLAPDDDLFVHGSDRAEPGWRQAALHREAS